MPPPSIGPIRRELASYEGACHAVQFYGDEGWLLDTVATFLTESLQPDEGIIVIATRGRRAPLLERLARRGLLPSRVVWQDAAAALERILTPAGPDRSRFRALLGELLGRTGAPLGRVRAYGEMVDVLFDDGRDTDAIALEALWNDVVTMTGLRLLCAYAGAHAASSERLPALDAVCASHDRVLPSEASLGAPSASLLARMAVLEHRASALESEVRRARELEAQHALLLERERRTRRELVAAAQRLRRLQRATAALSEALCPADVARVVAHDLRDALGADQAQLATVDSSGELVLVGADGGPPAPTDPALARAYRTGVPEVLEHPAEIAARYPDTTALQVGALACLPLLRGGRVLGVLGFTFLEPHAFSLGERELVRDLAQQAALALERSRLYERERLARQNEEILQRQLAFLADAGRALATSLDERETLATIARLTVDALPDACTVALCDAAGGLGMGAVAHQDPAKQGILEAVHATYGFDPARPHPTLRVLERGEPELIEALPDDWAEAIAQDERHLGYLRALAPRSLLLVPMRGSAARIVGVLGVSRSQGAPFDAADLALAQELAHRAALAVENARLYREATAAVRIRDEFLSIAGHELKTPLAALLLHLQGLDRRIASGVPAEAVHDRLGRGIANAERLCRLVDELLDVSRVATGRIRLEPEAVDLVAVVRESLARHAETATRAGCAVSFEAPAALVGSWDRLRIEQVVANLVSNALKYGQGKPVEVRLAERDGRAVLEVRDHGIGIAPEHQRRVFERFERAVSQRNYGGFGLGLWIVREVVEAHGGTIRLESAEQAGAHFTVELPLEAAS